MKDKIFYIFLFLGIAAFAIDMVTPKGTGVWAIYILLLVLYVRFTYYKSLFPLTGVYIFFLIVGFIFSPEGVIPQIAMVNRFVAIIIITLIVYLAYRESLTRKVNSEILDRISDSFIVIDKSWNVTYANKIADETSGINDTLIGRNIWKTVPELKGTVYEEKYKKAMETLQPVKFRAPDPHSNINVEISVYPSKEGLTVYGRDITAIVKKETDLEKSVSQKEVLVKEIHHRVKNNFQLISSLIRLSVLHIENDEIIKTIADIESRIRALSLIHEQLYKGSSESIVNMKIYLENLVTQLESTIPHETKINQVLIIDNIQLDIDTAISIGLIVNELYSNSIKHGFRHRSEGEITVEMHYPDDGNQLRLMYQDNGNGLPPGKNILETDSMGFTIVRTLIEQSHGNINLTNKNGLRFDITIQISEEANNIRT
jgi:PAS domain S-box-containing protein